MKFDDIEFAIEFVSSGYGEHEAFIDTENGHIYYVGDAIEELPPQDLYESKKYLQVPDKRDLGLGKNLAISFSSEKMPDHLNAVYDIFSRKGAYARFKELLFSLDLVESWYSYEQLALKKAIVDWCHENDIELNSGM